MKYNFASFSELVRLEPIRLGHMLANRQETSK